VIATDDPFAGIEARHVELAEALKTCSNTPASYSAFVDAYQRHLVVERDGVYPVARKIMGGRALVDEAEATNADLAQLIIGEPTDELLAQLAGAFDRHVKVHENRLFPGMREAHISQDALRTSIERASA
jgi:hypothetical protein